MRKVVGLGRVELPTYGLGNRRSIHLSYSPVIDVRLVYIHLGKTCRTFQITRDWATVADSPSSPAPHTCSPLGLGLLTRAAGPNSLHTSESSHHRRIPPNT